jgi:hypothetical protein
MTIKTSIPAIDTMPKRYECHFIISRARMLVLTRTNYETAIATVEIMSEMLCRLARSYARTITHDHQDAHIYY